ncbi:uncharacterized protein LOC132713636 [Ruditapes philippinarum]|uniref:uncharacterized protein LOC132713636 n=1 Tax=Ruditapes philippinarum TaxID=129788 RepID=UPI00295BB1DE|nr:uncharacterized protein LOC132713636 [Ruditapes philippinarum]
MPEKLTRLAEENCDFKVPCVDETFNKEQIDMMLATTNMSQELKTKQIECRLSARSVSCITVQHDANCTAEMAELQTTIAILKHSLSQCNISQENALFKKYGGEIKCQNPTNRCFTSSVTSRMSQCKPITMTTFMQQNQSAIQEICDDIECTSQCYTQAIGDCHKENKFVMIDPETIKISTRATCDNINVFASTIQHCRMRDTSCLRTLAKSMTSAQMYIHAEQFSEYKNLVCGATSRFRSCISFDVTENCTESMAILAKNLYEVWHSYSACGPVDNIMFQQYSGELTCDSGEKSEESRNSAKFQTPSVVVAVISLFLTLVKFVTQR